MAERVAEGTINVIGEIKGKNTVVISSGEISDKAYRRCMTGAAACQFSGVECTAPSTSGEVNVNALCDIPSRCGLSDESLQIGLDRLRAVAPSAKTSTVGS